MPEIGCFYNREIRLPGRDAADAPLGGLEFAAKECFDVAGHVTSFGNPTWAATHPPAPRTADLISLLTGAGAALGGKTHMNELAFGLDGDNPHFGMPRNPALPTAIPGGSSSGSAAAVAAGLVDFAIGTDTAGSIRVPASYCGLLAIRPTHGLLSLEGVIPLAQSFDVAGWFARSPEVFRRVAETLFPGGGNRRWVRALVPVEVVALLDPGVRPAFEGALQRVAGVVPALDSRTISPHGLGEWRELFRRVQGHEVWRNHGAWFTRHAPHMGREVAERLRWTGTITREEYAAGRVRMGEVARGIRGMLGDDRFLVMPTVAGPAPSRGLSPAEREGQRNTLLPFTCIAGLAGLPEITIPLATPAGPLGLSVIGPPGSEVALWELAEILHSLTRW